MTQQHVHAKKLNENTRNKCLIKVIKSLTLETNDKMRKHYLLDYSALGVKKNKTKTTTLILR